MDESSASLWDRVSGMGVPAKIVAAVIPSIVVTVVSITWFFSWKVNSLQGDLDKIYQALEAIKTDEYTLTMAERDALWEAIFNPGHRVPNPRKPGEFIVVDGEGKVGP